MCNQYPDNPFLLGQPHLDFAPVAQALTRVSAENTSKINKTERHFKMFMNG
jgi:hypothetical protein